MTDLKLVLCSEKFNSIIPINVSIWLREIRYQVAYYEDDGLSCCGLASELNVSSVSIYDNLCELENGISESEDEEDPKKAISSRQKLESIAEEPGETEVTDAVAIKGLTWPLRKRGKPFENQSVKNIVEYMLTKDSDLWFHLKDDNQQIICFNWLNSKLTIVKRVLNLNDVMHVEKVFEEPQCEEEVEPVTNLLAANEGKLNQECTWSLLNGITRAMYNETSSVVNSMVIFTREVVLYLFIYAYY